MISAIAALNTVREGNARFVSGVRSPGAVEFHTRRNMLVDGQEPFAVILGCSDSRVPVEIVFDQGLGDLFVIRVAGNIVARSQIGSVEFAAQKFGARLVIVLGHTRCGAIETTLDAMQSPAGNELHNLSLIVDRIRPSIEGLLAGKHEHDRKALVDKAVRANVCVAADHLRHGSNILEQMIAQDGLIIVGAEYSLETGLVDFFDGVPESAQ